MHIVLVYSVTMIYFFIYFFLIRSRGKLRPAPLSIQKKILIEKRSPPEYT